MRCDAAQQGEKKRRETIKYWKIEFNKRHAFYFDAHISSLFHYIGLFFCHRASRFRARLLAKRFLRNLIL